MEIFWYVLILHRQIPANRYIIRRDVQATQGFYRTLPAAFYRRSAKEHTLAITSLTQ
jgi:hypothetical protein